MENKIEKESPKEEYTIMHFMEDKTKKEEELEELQEELEELRDKIENKRVQYEEFVNRFLFRNSNLNVRVDFSGMED